MQENELTAVFDDIILGNGVKRIVHDLTLNGKDYSGLFKERLQVLGYKPVVLKDTDVAIGVRYPGFHLMDQKAWFGHLFWEVFTETRKRKIWGSVIRNSKGDWKYILSGKSSKKVYLNLNKPQAVDIHYLT